MRYTKLALKVEKLFFKDQQRIEINDANLYIVYEGNLTLSINDILKIEISKGSVINPDLQTPLNTSVLPVSQKNSIILSLNK